MDYSKTVNLPTTDFPMRANLPNKEPGILEKWENDKLYEKIQEKRKDAELFILHDGPPYANGHIHIGHALNKILKDVIIKHKTMSGFRVPYVPGWDCHGLPIELNVTKKMGSKAKESSKDEIRQGCRKYAGEFVDIQRDEFKRLGVLADYENPYLTMSNGYEAQIVETFADILEKEYIYRSKKPIYWCPSCVTALAEAEVEYDDHTSPSIFVKFKVDPETIKVEGVDAENTHVIIWTTTPWTLPANLAVCFHPQFEYGVYKIDDEYYVLAKGLVQQMAEKIGKEVKAEFPLDQQAIAELKVSHPFIDRESKVIFGDHVTLEQGTGIVHTAPGHGHEDYIVGLKYGLDVFCPVNDYGKFTDEYADMKGTSVWDANPKVVKLLEEKGVLLYTEPIDHSYPHCWRCKKPLIFRATEQWFFSIDHNNLRDKGLETVDKTEWVPSWGESRFRSMAESRPDWCLSRQRSWGVPIPSFRCEVCEKNNMSATSVKHFAKLSREKSIDIWYTEEIENLIPAGTKCSCGSEKFVKEFDILDVWFDSGVSHFAVLDNWPGHRWPADLYLEGSDQHRGWFQSSLWPALAVRDRAPYEIVLTHGFVLDENGKAMSKSVGNVVPPEKIIKQYGADILRLWVTSEDYRNDLRIGFDMVKQIADSYRRIRNTFKFLIGNISDFSDEMALPYAELTEIDKWILNKLAVLSEAVINHYNNYEFHLVYRKILNFCAVELSSIYFDISKDILYVEALDSVKRRGNQTVLYEIFNTLLGLVAPILSFTAEEIWMFLGRDGSVHMETYYSVKEEFKNKAIEEKIEQVVNVKKDVLKALESMRKDKTIKGSLEADVSIYVANDDLRGQLSEMGDEFRHFLQVAKVTLETEKQDGMEEFDTAAMSAQRTEGKKCVRCWNFFEELGTDTEHLELCQRCTDVVKSLG